mgnify:CR=1 FL=1
MITHNLPHFHINPDFEALLSPLTPEEFEQLEKNILREGCREPILIWNDTIIDGHNRYKICHKHNILFITKYISFDSIEEATSWICTNQLGRRNITEEVRKYLIGKKYEAEKTIGAHNKSGVNQYNIQEIQEPYPDDPPYLKKPRTANMLGKEFHISYNTVYKYGAFAKVLDQLLEKHPILAKKILSGELKISHEHMQDLGKMNDQILSKMDQYVLSHANEHYIHYQDMIYKIMPRPKINKDRKPIPSKPGSSDENLPLIKKIPAYDPDADISSLAYTIPSWISSIQRTKTVAQMENTTEAARTRLVKQLSDLKDTIELLVNLIEEIEST